jgi:hypothetical protein
MPSGLEWMVIISALNIAVVIIAYKIGKKVGRGQVFEEQARKN